MLSPAEMLQSLIGDLSVETFLADYWERKHLVVRREGEHPLFDFDERDIEARIRYSPCHFKKALRLVFHGHQVVREAMQESGGKEYDFDFAKIRGAYLSGATSIVNQTDRFSNRLLHGVRLLEKALGASAGINLYATPPSTQGYRVHYDSHDVLVIQISGAKHWQLFQQAVEYPFDGIREKYPVPPYGDPDHEFTLGPGDVLYCPRGLLHCARAARGEHSVHLTIGLQPLLWKDLLAYAIDAAALDHVDLRQSLPAGDLRNLNNVDKILEQARELLEKSKSRLSIETVVERFGKRWCPRGHFATPLPEASVIPREQARSLQPTSTLRQTKDLKVTEDDHWFGVEIEYRDHPFVLKQRLRPVWDWISKQESFQPQDLAEHLRKDDDPILFCEYLLNNGCLEQPT